MKYTVKQGIQTVICIDTHHFEGLGLHNEDGEYIGPLEPNVSWLKPNDVLDSENFIPSHSMSLNDYNLYSGDTILCYTMKCPSCGKHV